MNSETPNTYRPDDLWERIFVWSVWGAMTLAGIGYILRFGSNVPFKDDWRLIQEMASQPRTPSPAWLWQQDNVHRFPIGKLAQWTTWTLGGGDLRAGMLAGFLATSVTAAVLICVSRYLRQKSAYSDAAYPLILLHLGHWGTWLFFFLVAGGVGVSLICLAFALLIAAGLNRRLLAVAAAGGSAALLPLTGSTGVAVFPAVFLGLLAAGYAQWREGRKGNAAFLVVCALVGVSILGLFFVGHTFDVMPNAHAPQWRDAPRQTVLFWASSLGPVAGKLWPLSGIVVSGLLLASIVIGILTARTAADRGERSRRLMALCCVAGSAFVGLGVGWLRQGVGVASYYCLPASMLLVATYLSLTVRRPARVALFFQMSIFTMVGTATLYHAAEALRVGRERKERTELLCKDISEGIPLTGLVARHRYYWACPSVTEEQFRRDLEFMRAHSMWHFDKIKDDPAMEQKVVPFESLRACDIRRENGVWIVDGPRPRFVIRLDRPQRVNALSFMFYPEEGKLWNSWTVSWARQDAGDCGTSTSSEVVAMQFNVLRAVFERKVTVWVDQIVQEIVISPTAGAKVFKLTDVTLLIPSAPQSIALRAVTPRPAGSAGVGSDSLLCADPVGGSMAK